VTRGIGFADIGLYFDDDAGGEPGTSVMDQNLANEIARDVQRRTRIERSRQ